MLCDRIVADANVQQALERIGCPGAAGFGTSEDLAGIIMSAGVSSDTIEGLAEQMGVPAETLAATGAPIPGLYAVGNVSGGMFLNTYCHNINGMSHSRCITFGYLLGRRLAGLLD